MWQKTRSLKGASIPLRRRRACWCLRHSSKASRQRGVSLRVRFPDVQHQPDAEGPVHHVLVQQVVLDGLRPESLELPPGLPAVGAFLAHVREGHGPAALLGLIDLGHASGVDVPPEHVRFLLGVLDRGPDRAEKQRKAGISGADGTWGLHLARDDGSWHAPGRNPRKAFNVGQIVLGEREAHWAAALCPLSRHDVQCPAFLEGWPSKWPAFRAPRLRLKTCSLFPGGGLLKFQSLQCLLVEVNGFPGLLFLSSGYHFLLPHPSRRVGSEVRSRPLIRSGQGQPRKPVRDTPACLDQSPPA